MVANFDFSNQYDSTLFKIYYQSALKNIHTDFENPIRYGIVLNKSLWHQLLNFNSKKSNQNKIAFFSQFGTQKVFQSTNDLILTIKLIYCFESFIAILIISQLTY